MMKHFTLYNQKIFNTLNDPNKLEEKKIDCLPIDLPLLTRSSNCPELQREYTKQHEHKKSIRSIINKIKIYGKIKTENNKKYNDYYVCLKMLMYKYLYFGYYSAMNVMEYLIINEHNFDYRTFISLHINPLKMNNREYSALKCGIIFMNAFWDRFTHQELSEFYGKICSLQKEINTSIEQYHRSFIQDKLYNIIDSYNFDFMLDNYVLETFITYNLL